MFSLKIRPMMLSLLSFGAIAAGSSALAESHHHNNEGDGETPFVEGAGMSGMDGMSGMGGDHMAMMQSMMQMHMSMMTQMTMNGQISALFDGNDVDSSLADFDNNGDGMLDIDEYAVWDSQALRDMMVDRFQSIDADGSGDVTLDELQTTLDDMSTMDLMNGGMDDMDGDMSNMDGDESDG